MKNFTKLAGIIAFVVIIGFFLASCGGGGGDNSTPGGNDGGDGGELELTAWYSMADGNEYWIQFHYYGEGYLAFTDENYNEDRGYFTWTLSGNRVTIHYNGRSISGTVSESTMRLTDSNGTSMTLTKQ